MKRIPGAHRRHICVLAFAGIFLCFSTFATSIVLADEVGDPAEEPGGSYYSSPAQASHAAQLAEATAMTDTEVQDALEAYESAVEAGEEQSVIDTLEQDYIDTLEAKTGVIAEDVQDLRDQNMGWGKIAHELGVHPSALGLGLKKGHTNSNQFGPDKGLSVSDSEIAEATARDTRNGFAKGHGVGLTGNNKSSGKGIGRGKDKSGKSSGAGGLGTGVSGQGIGSSGGKGGSSDNSGKSGGKGKGNSGGNGKGGGQGNGNSGGNGNGNGGGKGGGKK